MFNPHHLVVGQAEDGQQPEGGHTSNVLDGVVYTQHQGTIHFSTLQVSPSDRALPWSQHEWCLVGIKAVNIPMHMLTSHQWWSSLLNGG